jgi:hypothetical protein
MPALTLLIIRHAEKPGGDWPGPGLTEGGVADTKSLVIRGWQRAGAWATLFGAGMGGAEFPTPTAIYAADPATAPGAAEVENDGPSKRPYETITPLAAKLALTPVTTWAEGQESQLVSEVTGLSGVVLIAWEHRKIISAVLPDIAKGANLGIPADWPGHRFDVVLRFDRAGHDHPWTFQQLFPRLMSGDSDEPLP